MERSVLVRKPHSSTMDLLTWPKADRLEVDSGSRRPYQPSREISKVLFGGQMKEEEAKIVLRRGDGAGSDGGDAGGEEEDELGDKRSRVRREESVQVESERRVVGRGRRGVRDEEMAMDLDGKAEMEGVGRGKASGEMEESKGRGKGSGWEKDPRNPTKHRNKNF